MTGIYRTGTQGCSTSRLRERMRERNASVLAAPPRTSPPIGPRDVVLPNVNRKIDALAMQAQGGDMVARDTLYDLLLPWLRFQNEYVPKPRASATAIGMWDEDDIAQEGYLAFIDLVESWSGEERFHVYLSQRYVRRVKDRIFRGIGRPPSPPRYGRVDDDDTGMASSVDPTPAIDRRAIMTALLETLPPHLARAAVMHGNHGHSKAEIAASMGVSRRTMVRYWGELRSRTRRFLADWMSVDMGQGQ